MDTKVKPFESFSIVYKILIRVGYYRNFNETNSRFIKMHSLYRFMALIFVFVYNMLYIIFIIQPNNDLGLRLESLMIEIPQINLFCKLFNLFLYTSRVDKINKLINDPIFAAKGDEDEKIVMKNVKEAYRLSIVINVFVTITAICWSTSKMVQALRDESAMVPAYVPFAVDTVWAKCATIFLLQTLTTPWVGYGHIALDCLVATYYAQAQVQLKIIKHNLQHLFDTRDAKRTLRRYRDNTDEEEYANFVYYVKRYEKLVWYIKEVNSVFNPSMTIQFFTSSAAMCMVIYQLSHTDVLSVKFLFLMALIFLLMTQVFLYCYYGNLVRDESESLNTAVYISGWTSTTPRLRRTMLISMARWSRPLTTQVGGIIPLALGTFISIVKFSYTLYTVLTTKQHNFIK